jgi:hypothetical protein
MSKSTLPRVPNGHRYCWTVHSSTHVHCTQPIGHAGKHWHPYTKTSW